MNTDLIARMHEALNTLTRAHVVIVEDDHGGFLGTRNEPPLYAKLRSAVIGGRGDGSKGIAARESTPLNVSAVDLLTLITKRVRGWYADEGVVLTAERVDVTTIRWASVVTLAFRRGELSEQGYAKRVASVEAIVAAIRDLLDPPYRFELTTPCPECDAEFLTTAETRSRVLVVTEMTPLDKSFVSCRACGHEWRGIHEARRLSLETDTR